MLDSNIYDMTLKLPKNHIFGGKTSRICHLLRNVIIEVIMLGTWLIFFVALHYFTPTRGVMSCDILKNHISHKDIT